MEAVQEFPLEIHKSLPSNGLRIPSLIKVVSLLARTYGKKRRILGQPPRASMISPRRFPLRLRDSGEISDRREPDLMSHLVVREREHHGYSISADGVPSLYLP